MPICAEEPAQQEEDLVSSTRRYLNDSLQQASMPEAFEPEEFKGMLFHDGADSQGRPVIVVNTDAVGTGRKARSAAMQYMLHRLEPIVTQVSVYLQQDSCYRLQANLSWCATFELHALLCLALFCCHTFDHANLCTTVTLSKVFGNGCSCC